MISGSTRILGVIGHPVRHSLSPAMHNAAFAALGLEYCYVPFDVLPDAIPKAIAGMRALGIVGLNVTVPHKPAVYTQMNRLAESALAVEAVNTVQLLDGELVGHNTDAEGFARSLEEAGIPLAGKKVALLGAGGAARSVAAACVQRGAASLCVLNRTVHRAAELEQRIVAWMDRTSTGDTPRTAVTSMPLSHAPEQLPLADIVVHSTSVGMYPHGDEDSLVSGKLVRKGAVAYDLIYRPAQTRFLQEASEVGAVVVNGVDMLVCQGAVAFEIWTGVGPPIPVMRNALLAALNA